MKITISATLTPEAYRIYKEWFHNKLGEKKEEAEHFGNTMAVNAGDIVETFGPELIAGSNFPDPLKIKAIQIKIKHRNAEIPLNDQKV